MCACTGGPSTPGALAVQPVVARGSQKTLFGVLGREAEQCPLEREVFSGKILCNPQAAEWGQEPRCVHPCTRMVV